MTTFITGMGKFLPGDPVSNDAMEEYPGKIQLSALASRGAVQKTACGLGPRPNLWRTTRCHHIGQETFALDTAFILIDAIAQLTGWAIRWV